ncbi:hypothetical protein AHF37_00706 [Paragonimus kellicotti]|nr:hypothetical protein AHF37_00706 [Paragonimus kellicotti]
MSTEATRRPQQRVEYDSYGEPIIEPSDDPEEREQNVPPISTHRSSRRRGAHTQANANRAEVVNATCGHGLQPVQPMHPTVCLVGYVTGVLAKRLDLAGHATIVRSMRPKPVQLKRSDLCFGQAQLTMAPIPQPIDRRNNRSL